MIVQIEKALDRQFAKFQPVADAGFKLPKKTRLYLEYGNDDTYLEYDPTTGDLEEQGILDRPDRVEVVSDAA